MRTNTCSSSTPARSGRNIADTPAPGTPCIWGKRERMWFRICCPYTRVQPIRRSALGSWAGTLPASYGADTIPKSRIYTGESSSAKRKRAVHFFPLHIPAGFACHNPTLPLPFPVTAPRSLSPAETRSPHVCRRHSFFFIYDPSCKILVYRPLLFYRIRLKCPRHFWRVSNFFRCVVS